MVRLVQWLADDPSLSGWIGPHAGSMPRITIHACLPTWRTMESVGSNRSTAVPRLLSCQASGTSSHGGSLPTTPVDSLAEEVSVAGVLHALLQEVDEHAATVHDPIGAVSLNGDVEPAVGDHLPPRDRSPLDGAVPQCIKCLGFVGMRGLEIVARAQGR
jgi:hypothetical protein